MKIRFFTVALLLTLSLGVTHSADAAPKAKRSAKTNIAEANAAQENDSYLVGSPAEYDPLEPFNRGIFVFNKNVDFFIIRPVAYVYRGVLPEWGRNRVTSFFDNLEAPINVANSLIQGNVDNAIVSFWRFVINTLFGFGGVFDQASQFGLTASKEDFGQSLGAYGVGQGPYLMLPILGPSSVRDTFGMIVDMAFDPITYIDDDLTQGIFIGVEAIDGRANLLKLTDQIDRTSLDPYASYRSLYLQRRASEVKNRGAEGTLNK